MLLTGTKALEMKVSGRHQHGDSLGCLRVACDQPNGDEQPFEGEAEQYAQPERGQAGGDRAVEAISDGKPQGRADHQAPGHQGRVGQTAPGHHRRTRDRQGTETVEQALFEVLGHPGRRSHARVQHGGGDEPGH
jgi:hypothetical protein